MPSQTISFEKNGRISGLYELSKAITAKGVRDSVVEFENRNRELTTYSHSSTYDLIVDGIAYPPKAIFGLALTKATGFTVTSNHFSGGLDTPCFRRLEELGFQIVTKTKNAEQKQSPWSDNEFKDSVKAYLLMLSPEFTQNKTTKKQVYEELSLKYNRSPKAYEFRMQNISFVFELLGRKWVKGLKPKRNITSNQVTLVERYIAECEGRPFENLTSFEMEVKKSFDDKNSPKPTGSKEPKQSTINTTVYERSSKVKAWVLKRAKGTCECCDSPAPFTTADDRPFLEVHHLIRLVDGGSDTPDNCVAVCPNCHRQLHFGKNNDTLTDQLFSKLEKL